MNDSAIIFNEVIESYTKLSPKGDKKKTSFNEKKKFVKHKISILYMPFY